MSARTENYKAPHLKALDNKLKSIITEKKNRLMNNMRSPLKQVNDNQTLKEDQNMSANIHNSQISHENQFLKKKVMEMQRVISELNQNTTRNSHLEYLKREIDSK